MSEGLNPFEPPKAEWSESEPVSYFRDASQGTRLVNSLVDSVTQWLIGMALLLMGFGEVMMLFVLLAY